MNMLVLPHRETDILTFTHINEVTHRHTCIFIGSNVLTHIVTIYPDVKFTH